MMQKKKCVLITGCSSGIGKACAEHLSHKGFHVFATFRKQEDAERLELDSPHNLTPLTLDITQYDKIQCIKDIIHKEAEWADLWGVINNTGITSPGPFEAMHIEDIRNVVEVNLIGLMNLTHAFIPLLRKSRGRIVNIGSAAGNIGFPFFAAYCATKFAVSGFSEALRLELKPSGIHVTLVELGNVSTPLWQKGIENIDRIEQSSSSELSKLYSGASAAFKRTLETNKKQGIPPMKVAKKIETILSCKNPHPNYLIGKEAVACSAISTFLPRKLREIIVMKISKISET